MKIHHISCGTMCPFGGKLMDGISHALGPSRLVCHCLLIETDQGLVLVDTGLGMQDVAHPEQRLNSFFRKTMRVQLDSDQTAVAQVRRLGFQPEDVRHIVLTHLDFDHAGGIEDFPHAQVHLYRRELYAAQHRQGFIAKGRYRPQQWDDQVQWQQYDEQGEPWFGFESIRSLRGLPPEILLIPLIGHTWGHCGVAVQTESGWLLHAGDAYFYRNEVHAPTPHCTPGLRAYQTMMEVDREKRRHNQARLHELVQLHGRDITVFCAHDRLEFDALSGAVRVTAGN